MTEPRRSGDPTSVLRRTFAVLSAFDQRASRLTLSELAASTGLPKTTVHRMAVALVDLEMLERRTGGYALGPRLFELGQQVPRQRQLRDLALPYLQDLHQATRSMTQLAALERFEVLYIEVLYGHRRVMSSTGPGRRMPWHCTALGKAIMAVAPESVLEDALAQPLVRRTPQTITDPGVLRQELSVVRETGVAFDRGESDRGLRCAAAPILAHEGNALGAVSIAASHRSMIDLNRAASFVKDAADGIAHAARSALLVA